MKLGGLTKAVTSFDEEFNEISGKAAERQALENSRDLNHEIAGVDTGRHTRFLTADNTRHNLSKKKEQDRVYQTLLDMMLRDPVYARLHAGAIEALTNAEETVRTVLDEVLAKLEEERAMLQEMLDRAPIVDGKRVFKDDGGNVWTEHGERVPDDVAVTIEWRGNEFSHERFTGKQDSIETLENKVTKLRGVETELGDIRGELSDTDNPASADRLQELNDRADELQGIAGEQRTDLKNAPPSIETADIPEDNPTEFSTTPLKLQ